MSAILPNELRTLLTGYQGATAQHLLAGAPAEITDEELDSIEHRILSDPNVKTGVRDLLTALRAQADQVCPILKKNPLKVVLSYPTAKNPFAKGVAAPDGIYNDGANWFAAHRAAAEKRPLRSTRVEEAARWFQLYLVAAVLEFEILDLSYLPALIRSLTRQCKEGGKRILRLHRTLAAIPLALAYRGGEKQEERLLVSGAQSNPLLQRFLDHPKCDDLLDLLAKGMPAADRIVAGVDTQLPANDRSNLIDLIKAAQSVARLRMRPAIASHRGREFVSHSLRIDVLNRLGAYSLAPFEKDRSHAARPSEAFADDPKCGQPPAWMVELRKAVKRDKIDRRALERLSNGDDVCGRRIAKYALSLKRGASTVHRYVFLIATRLMPRFDSSAGSPSAVEDELVSDPLHVEEEAWEEVIEQVLDEDEFYRRPDVENSDTRRRVGHSQPLLQAMHSFVRFLEGDKKELASLHKKFPASGLMQVDANLVSVDEYKAALDWLGSVEVYPDTELIESSRVALILGYRCGLRRAESGYLRLGDFDDADFLHVRPTRMRKLKTSNALRDLPLGPLIPPDELKMVKRRIQRIRDAAEAELRRQSTGGKTHDRSSGQKAGKETNQRMQTWRDALLFPTRKDPFRPGDFETIIDRVHESIRAPKEEFPGDREFHYHILRHSFANLTLLKLWPELHLVARRLFHRHPETLAWIADCEQFRKELFGTCAIRGNDLQAVALLMGHGSAATTLEHYLHLVDFYRTESAEATGAKGAEGEEESGTEAA